MGWSLYSILLAQKSMKDIKVHTSNFLKDMVQNYTLYEAPIKTIISVIIDKMCDIEVDNQDFVKLKHLMISPLAELLRTNAEITLWSIKDALESSHGKEVFNYDEDIFGDSLGKEVLEYYKKNINNDIRSYDIVYLYLMVKEIVNMWLTFHNVSANIFNPDSDAHICNVYNAIITKKVDI